MKKYALKGLFYLTILPRVFYRQYVKIHLKEGYVVVSHTWGYDNRFRTRRYRD